VTGPLLATAVVAFMGTTVDDLVILAVLFMARRSTGRPRAATIVAGQYAGFAGILAVALTAAAGLAVVPDQWVGLLGLVPIGVGVWGLWRLRGRDRDPRPVLSATGAQIAAITFANGADNISVFTPLFRSLHVAGSLTAVIVFLILVAVWCATGAVLGGHRIAIATLGRISGWIVPTVFLAVGVLILMTSGTLAALGRVL
jgi:cadmium resistance protein CadD (predicted permease)